MIATTKFEFKVVEKWKGKQKRQNYLFSLTNSNEYWNHHSKSKCLQLKPVIIRSKTLELQSNEGINLSKEWYNHGAATITLA